MSDLNLVERMLRGDNSAFEEFFGTYFPGLFRFVLLRTGRNEDVAEEIVQRALCKAITKIGTFRGEASLFTWLCTFCRHEISGFMKEQGRLQYQAEYLDSPEMNAALESLLVMAQDRPDQAVLRKELGYFVQLALEALPSHYSDALEWKYIEGVSVKEIADRTGQGPKAVESMLSRARQAFRDAFYAVSSEAAWLVPASEG